MQFCDSDEQPMQVVDMYSKIVVFPCGLTFRKIIRFCLFTEKTVLIKSAFSVYLKNKIEDRFVYCLRQPRVTQ